MINGVLVHGICNGGYSITVVSQTGRVDACTVLSELEKKFGVQFTGCVGAIENELDYETRKLPFWQIKFYRIVDAVVKKYGLKQQKIENLTERFCAENIGDATQMALKYARTISDI